MIFKRSSNTKEDAVSPVVGVMLMLVVTVIIAAMVVAFSSGLAEDVEKAPSAVLDVQYYSMLSVGAGGMPYNTPSFRLLYLVGDTNLDTGLMTISSSWTVDGERYSNIFSGSDYTEEGFTPFLLRSTENMYSNNEPDMAFGRCIMEPGESLITNVNMAWMGDDSCGVSDILGPDYDTIEKGTEISITITYDDHIIFDDEVIAQ